MRRSWIHPTAVAAIVALVLIGSGALAQAGPAIEDERGEDNGCPGVESAQVYPFEKPAASADGSVVAFTTAAALSPDDTNGALDVYAWTSSEDAYERVSLARDGSGSEHPSRSPAITPDGRFVAFESGGQLVPGDADGIAPDVFVYDRHGGELEQVSTGLSDEPTLGEATNPTISDDGNVVTFASAAPNLVDGDTNGVVDVFVTDRAEGETVRASVSSDGEQASDRSGARYRGLDLSGDGRYVVFASGDNGLAPDATGNVNVFVHDLETRTTELVSETGEGPMEASLLLVSSVFPSISEDGRFVAFASSTLDPTSPWDLATILDFTQTQVFVHDRVDGTVELVSVGQGGSAPDGPSYAPSISADGRSVGFASSANNLAPGDDNQARDVFLRDLATDTTTRVSVGPGGDGSRPGGDLAWGSFSPTIASDGDAGAFASGATNLAPADRNGAFDIFVWGTGSDGQLERLATPCPDLAKGSSSSIPSADASEADDGRAGTDELGLAWTAGLLLLPASGALIWGTRRSRVSLAAGVLVVGLSIAPAAAHHYAPLQPGAPGPGADSTPTLNFVFEDDAGDLYIGTCGHCTRPLWGTDGPVGADVSVPGHQKIGTIVYGRYGLYDAHKQDFALVKVDEDKEHLVDPAVRGWGGPTGVETEPVPGTPTLSYGFGMGVQTTEATRAQQGVLAHVEETGAWKGWYFDDRAIAGGNSGSPVLTADGKALGTIIIAAAAVGQPGANGGPTAEYILTELRLAGFDLDLVSAPYPGDALERAQHCANKPIDEGAGGGCADLPAG